MKKNRINHYSTYSTLKASIVERFNRTLKNMMQKEFSYEGTYKWIDNYQKLTKDYNESVHRTIKMPPNKVKRSNESFLLNTSYNRLKKYDKPKFKVNQNRSKYKHMFEKGYTPNWTIEIFQIYKIKNTNPSTYLLHYYQGYEIKGSFYTEELQKSRYPDTYLVEKVLKTNTEKTNLIKTL